MWHSGFEPPHLKNKSVPEQLSISRVPKQEVQETLHHPGPVGFSRVHSGRNHHSFLGPALNLANRLRCYCHQVHCVPGKAVAKHPHLAVRCNCWVGRNTPEIALQVWIRVGVAVGHVAGVWLVSKLESPGEWVQGDAVVFVFCILRRDRDGDFKDTSVVK